MKSFPSIAAPGMGAEGGAFSGMVPLWGNRTASQFARHSPGDVRLLPMGVKLVFGVRYISLNFQPGAGDSSETFISRRMRFVFG